MKWVGPSGDFGTAIITTTKDGHIGETSVPQGLRVVLNNDGELEITISQHVQDELNKIEDQIKVPRCESPATRNDIDCSSKRIAPIIAGIIGNTFLMGQINYAEREARQHLGIDERYLEETNQMISLFDETLIHEALGAAAGGDSHRFDSMNPKLGGMVASMGIYGGISGDADNLRKIKGTPVTILKYPRPPKDECPKKIELACSGVRCQGRFGACLKEWKGCPCTSSGETIHDSFFWGNNLEAVMAVVREYQIPVPLARQNEHCYEPNQFGEHGDIHEAELRLRAGWLCYAAKSLSRIKAGDASTNKDLFVGPYQFNTYWKNGCELETGETEMGMLDPLATGKAEVNTCVDIFADNWKRCNNWGTGGSVQYGCLVYEFKGTNTLV